MDSICEDQERRERKWKAGREEYSRLERVLKRVIEKNFASRGVSEEESEKTEKIFKDENVECGWRWRLGEFTPRILNNLPERR